jgi:DNA-binding transcriptional MerR regulator
MERVSVGRSAYKIDALVAEGFSVRTIHWYTSSGVLPRPEGRGPAAIYGDEHILILRKIKRARDERRLLADIKEECAHLYRRAARRAG